MKKELTVDITELPTNIREAIYKHYSDCGIANGSYKKWYVHDEQKPRAEHKGGKILYVDKSIDYIVEEGDDIISDYFLSQGIKRGKELLIKIWW